MELRKDAYVNKKLTLLSHNYSFFQRSTTFWDFPIIFSRPGSFFSDCQYIIKKQKSLDLKLNQEILGGCDCDAQWVLTHLQNLQVCVKYLLSFISNTWPSSNSLVISESQIISYKCNQSNQSNSYSQRWKNFMK